MVGTLVVTLPSPFRGGAFVIEHKGEKVICRASRRPLSFVAFYADCQHEVRPVLAGFRVVLTYDLMLAGEPAARLVLEDRWVWLKEAIEDARGETPPSRRDRALASLARPILGWLDAAAGAGEMEGEAAALLSAPGNESLFPCLMAVLRAAAARPPERAVPALEDLARHCARLLSARLERPARVEDDWSIALPGGCACPLCGRLGAFLADPKQRRLEWPLAKEARRHVHDRLDAYELPVRHGTRRAGRPYVLVLEKKEALFEREAAERRRWRAELEWLGRGARRLSRHRGGVGGRAYEL
jgi:hypothetical protein